MAEPGCKSVLFVCLGNICRSPIAEAVFRKLVTEQKLSDYWRIDSAATSTYEIGNPPDYRGQNCMKKHGVAMKHVARQPYKMYRPCRPSKAVDWHLKQEAMSSDEILKPLKREAAECFEDQLSNKSCI